MSPLATPLPFLFIAATTLGLLMHDTQADHAATIAITNPVSFSDYASSEVTSRSNEHLHVEKVSVSSQRNGASRVTTHVQARDDDRRYVQSKKSAYDGGDTHGLWPSA